MIPLVISLITAAITPQRPFPDDTIGTEPSIYCAANEKDDEKLSEEKTAIIPMTTREPIYAAFCDILTRRKIGKMHIKMTTEDNPIMRVILRFFGLIKQSKSAVIEQGMLYARFRITPIESLDLPVTCA